MIAPETVEYGKVIIKRIIYKEKNYSIAELSIDNTDKYGIRWNGAEDENSLGTPTAFGKPTWFILPNNVVDAFIRINVKGDNQ